MAQRHAVARAYGLGSSRSVQHGRGGRGIVVPGPVGGVREDAAVEDACGQKGHVACRATVDQSGGRLVEQCVPAGDQHAVDVAALQEGLGSGHRVGTDRHGVDHALAAQFRQSPVRAA